MLNETYQKLVNKHFQNSGIDQQKLEDFTKDVIRAICDIIDNNTSMINTITIIDSINKEFGTRFKFNLSEEP